MRYYPVRTGISIFKQAVERRTIKLYTINKIWISHRMFVGIQINRGRVHLSFRIWENRNQEFFIL